VLVRHEGLQASGDAGPSSAIERVGSSASDTEPA
jgi:hypothetical protein